MKGKANAKNLKAKTKAGGIFLLLFSIILIGKRLVTLFSGKDLLVLARHTKLN